MVYEWDPAKAAANLNKHGVSFAEAASVFLDPMALTFDNPDHSDEEGREMTIGVSSKQALFLCPIAKDMIGSGSSAHEKQPKGRGNNMRKELAKVINDEIRPEYDLSQLRGGVRGKYCHDSLEMSYL